MPNPANPFHSWTYRARPDALRVVRAHPSHVAAGPIAAPLDQERTEVSRGLLQTIA